MYSTTDSAAPTVPFSLTLWSLESHPQPLPFDPLFIQFAPVFVAQRAPFSPRSPRRIQSSFSGSTAPFRLIRGSFESHRFPLSNDPAINPNAPLIVRQRPQHCPYPLPDAVRLFSMFVVFVFASRNRSLHSWYLQHYRGPSYHIPSGLKPHWPPPYARYRGPRTLSLVRLRRSSRCPHDIIVCPFGMTPPLLRPLKDLPLIYRRVPPRTN